MSLSLIRRGAIAKGGLCESIQRIITLFSSPMYITYAPPPLPPYECCSAFCYHANTLGLPFDFQEDGGGGGGGGLINNFSPKLGDKFYILQLLPYIYISIL